VSTTVTAPPRFARAQRRTIRVLLVAQVMSGVGVSIGLAVGALLVARIAGGPRLAGVAQTGFAVGAALLAIPVTRLMQARGRRPGLVLSYAVGMVGGLLIIAAAAFDSVVLAFAGLFLFGGGTTANLQARYVGVDLAEPHRRGRQLSLVVWATTIGSVAGPNLAAPADRLLEPFGLPALTGSFAFSVAAFGVAAVVLELLLRPDPLLLSRTLPPLAEPPVAEPPGAAEPPGVAGLAAVSEPSVVRGPMAHAFAEIRRSPAALLGLVAVAAGHAVMLAVMVMTPLYIDDMLTHGHAHHADVLTVVGVVISLHVAGMYALSPLVGYAADRYGRHQVIVVGGLLLIVACVLAARAVGPVDLSVGLFLIGLGWSCTMVAGSTLLTESVPVAVRPAAQGLNDLVMGLGGASAGAVSGVIVAWAGYPVLALGSALIAVPLVVAAGRQVWRQGRQQGRRQGRLARERG
jgi:MFS family permease